MLEVPPNKVFRAIVKRIPAYRWAWEVCIFEETEQEKLDKQTLSTLITIITTEVPGAELMLFGNRARGTYDAQSDWDILILTTSRSSSPGPQMGIAGKIVPHYHTTRHTCKYFASPQVQWLHRPRI